MTATGERLVRELRKISEEIEPKLHLVSQDARNEWNALQTRWPFPGELREGAKALTEEQLKGIEAKVHRFRDIVQGFAAKVTEPSFPREELVKERA